MAMTTHCEPNRLAASDRNSGPGHRGRVDRHLVRAGPQQRVDVVDGPDPAADRQRDEHLLGGAPDHLVGAAPVVAGRGDVQEGQLVGALLVVPAGQLDRVAGVDQIDEVDALDHPALGDVEARDDANGDGHVHQPTNSPAIASTTGDRAALEGIGMATLDRDPTDEAPGSTDPAVADPADAFCRLACLVYSEQDGPDRWSAARSILAANPDITDRSIAAAAATADPAAIGHHLEHNRDAARLENRATPVGSAAVPGLLAGALRGRTRRPLRGLRPSPAGVGRRPRMPASCGAA